MPHVIYLNNLISASKLIIVTTVKFVIVIGLY